MIGTRVGPYELLEELGRGGMATVYKAYQPSMDRHVAIKVMHKRLADELDSVERFQREARLVARLEHPHILPVYDFDGAHTPQYIVMRFLPGGTLKDVLARQPGRLSAGFVVRFLRQVASALGYAHRQGIVHRDLKPSNVMVDGDGNAFLTDFGIARTLARPDLALTETGAVLGTPGYMAPEQAMGTSDVGPAADLYALGVLTFELLTGKLPFEATTAVAMALRHVHESPPRASGKNPALDAAVDAVLLRALAKRPADRHPSATDFADELAAALGDAAATPAPLTPPPGAPTASDAHGAATGLRTTTRSRQNRLITVLCLNAAEYAELVEETDGSEAAHLAQDTLWAQVSATLTRFGGEILTHAETSLLAVWGADTTREDDVERAVRAAVAVREGFRQLAPSSSPEEPLPLRIGVHTGVVLLTPATTTGSSAPYTASGATVSIATRLAERAEGGILISHDTFREVRGVFSLAPGRPLPVRGRRGGAAGGEAVALPTYQVLAAKPRSFRGVRARGVEDVETTLVGRRAELEVLQKAFLTVVEDREPQVITVLGGAGLGKSRLLDEFDKWADLRPERYFLFRGRATQATGLTPFALIRDLLAFRFEILDDDDPATARRKIERGIAEMLGLKETEEEMAHLVGHLAGFDLGPSRHVDGLLGDPQQLAARARRLFIRFFERLGAVHPVVMSLEDAHHADDASLDLLAELVGTRVALPLLVVCLARPSLLERRPAWGSGQPFHKRLSLEPLDRRDSRALVQEILKRAADVPAALRDLLAERAEGNPLFMEELVKMLIEDRVILKGPDEVWHVETSRLDRLPVPQTLAGLLQARLDTLLAPEKVVLQRGAVIGRVFCDVAVQALDAADDPAARVADLPATLAGLTQRGFLQRRESSSFEGGVDYLFAQNMLRDLIYDSMLRRQRSTYHAALATWLAGSRRGDEYLALIAEHCEKADQRQLAVEYLQRAGDRARAICAFSEARGFYQRAVLLSEAGEATLVTAPLHAVATASRLGEAAPAVAEPGERELRLRLALGAVSRLLGAYAEAATHLEVALAQARNATDQGSIAAALYEQSQLASVRGDWGRAQALLDESLPLARAAGAAGTLAQVLYGLGDLQWRASRLDEATATLEESLAQARLAQDQTGVLYALNRLGSVAMFQKKTAEAWARFEEGRELASRTGNRERLAAFLNNLGELERLQGSNVVARDLYREALATIREIGRPDFEAAVLANLGAVSMHLGELAEAERYAREGLATARAIGFLPMVLGALTIFAQLRARGGDHAEALALLGLVLDHPAADADLRAYASPVLDQLRQGLAPDVVEAGLARGRDLPFEATVAGLVGAGGSSA